MTDPLNPEAPHAPNTPDLNDVEEPQVPEEAPAKQVINDEGPEGQEPPD